MRPFKPPMLRLASTWLLILAAPAPADWSAPERVPRSADGSAPQIAVSRAGTPLVLFTIDGPFGDQSLREGGGRLVDEDIGTFAGPVTYGRDGFGFAWTGGRQKRLYAELGGARRRVASGRRLVSLKIAANARGDVALAWLDDRGTASDEVMVVTRRPGGRFGRPVRLGRGKVRSVSVAVGARGQVLVAWNAFGTVRARMLGGPAETIRAEEAFAARLQTSLDGQRALVGWVAKFRSEGGDARETFVQVAERPRGARRFGNARLLARHAGEEGALRLDGARYAWSAPDGIFVGGGTRVAPPGARLADLAGAVVWEQGGRVHADGVVISGERASEADAAVDPRTGQPVAVWVQDGGLMTAFRG